MSEIIITTKADLKSAITESIKDALAIKRDPPPEQTRKEPFTKTELKRLLKVSMPTIDRWSKQGILERFTVGGRVYFSAESVQKLLK